LITYVVLYPVLDHLPRKDLLRFDEVTAYFTISRRTVYRLIRAGVLVKVKVRGALFVTRASIERALRQG
jgi:excisionase family DNA binding protein